MALLHNSAPISTCAQHSLRETRGSKEATLPSTDFRMQLDLRRGIFFRRSFSGTSGTVPFLVAFHSLYTVVLLIDNCSGSKTEKKTGFHTGHKGWFFLADLEGFMIWCQDKYNVPFCSWATPEQLPANCFFRWAKPGTWHHMIPSEHTSKCKIKGVIS